MLDSSLRLLSMAFTKLLEESRYNQINLKNKMRFVIETFTNQDKNAILMAYNAMKQHRLVIVGCNITNSRMKQINLIKRLMNQSHNLEIMAINCLKEFLASERAQEEKDRIQKDHFIRRIMDSNTRLLGAAFRQAKIYSQDEQKKEQN